ncbi:MAG: hypothetical protein EKK42_27100 [Pseudonocardiaceae bacterium]|nr:MAG: hypothetical protein EKK42_27100 [Pseudonocardiaceae bacterium]
MALRTIRSARSCCSCSLALDGALQAEISCSRSLSVMVISLLGGCRGAYRSGPTDLLARVVALSLLVDPFEVPVVARYQGHRDDTWHVVGVIAIRSRHNLRDERAGFPSVRLHDFRHTVVTLLLQLGAAPHVVQAIARHADLDVTSGIYAQTNLDAMREALDEIEWEF